jgi:hypothetical protein
MVALIVGQAAVYAQPIATRAEGGATPPGWHTHQPRPRRVDRDNPPGHIHSTEHARGKGPDTQRHGTDAGPDRTHTTPAENISLHSVYASHKQRARTPTGRTTHSEASGDPTEQGQRAACRDHPAMCCAPCGHAPAFGCASVGGPVLGTACVLNVKLDRSSQDSKWLFMVAKKVHY